MEMMHQILVSFRCYLEQDVSVKVMQFALWDIPLVVLSQQCLVLGYHPEPCI